MGKIENFTLKNKTFIVESEYLMKKIPKLEIKLVLFLAYIIAITISIFKYGYKSSLYVHIIFVVIFSIFYFGFKFIYIAIAPVMAILGLINTLIIKIILKKYDKNIPRETVIILGHPDRTKLEGWIKPDILYDELKDLLNYLKKKKSIFSFYEKATLEDVENIMQNSLIKEVYFFGHGSSHTFQLTNDVYVYYCDFIDEKYRKDFAHQVHCGTKYGKSLIDYVVPKENQEKCFLIRKPINGITIRKEFKRRAKELN